MNACLSARCRNQGCLLHLAFAAASVSETGTRIGSLSSSKPVMKRDTAHYRPLEEYVGYNLGIEVQKGTRLGM